MKSRRSLVGGIAVGLILVLAAGLTRAQEPQPPGGVSVQAALGTAFTYQGQLKKDGTPISGTCDFQFSLWDSSSNSTGQIGSTQTRTGVQVSNGYFTIPDLDFGAGAFQGDARWLQIAVKCTGDASYTTLSPRQALTAAPYALYARSAWSLTGNSGTTPGTNFLGTTDNQALEFKAYGQRILRLEPSNNLIGGYSGNSVGSSTVGATIGGGGSNTSPNSVTGNYGTIGGGHTNTVGGFAATIGGGRQNTAGSQDVTIGGGAANNASGQAATIAGGNLNTASGYATTVSGGGNNQALGDGAAVGGGMNNKVSGGNSVIGGGAYNTISATVAVIGGGHSNLITGTANYATIAGGYHITVTGQYAAVGGGSDNIASGQGATVGGGSNNTASNTGATVGGGSGNTASGQGATVGGGSNNTVSGWNATVAGGGGNTASGVNATVGGGYGNTASDGDATVAGGHQNTAGYRAAVGGGQNNNASGYWATIGGGYQNTANGDHAAIGGGSNNMASGEDATIGGGYGNAASGTYATVPGGKQGSASLYGQMAYASGAFATPGDAQTSLYVMRLGASPMNYGNWWDLYLDGSSTFLTIASGRTMTFDILVVGRSSGGESAGYRIQGVIENFGGTVAFIGTPMVTTLGEDDSVWDVRVVAGDGALKVQAMGNGETIRWVATVRTAEISW